MQGLARNEATYLMAGNPNLVPDGVFAACPPQLLSAADADNMLVLENPC